jgi:hypothetical protein
LLAGWSTVALMPFLRIELTTSGLPSKPTTMMSLFLAAWTAA